MLPGLASLAGLTGVGRIDVVGYATGTGTSIATTSLTGGIDTEARIGDLLIVMIVHSDGGGDLNLSVTDATLTWAEVADLYANDADDTQLSVSWAYASVAPPASVTISYDGGSADAGKQVTLVVLRGQNVASPIDATTTTATGTSSTAINPAAITPATSGAMVIVFGAFACDWLQSYAVTDPPSGYTSILIARGNGGTARSDVSVSIAYKANAAAGVAEDPGAFTADGTDADCSWAAVTMAIRPA